MPEATNSYHPARSLMLIFGMPLVLAAIYYAWLAVQVGRTRYAWKDMDWNGDGRVTIGEYFETADVLERPVQQDGRECTELYSARHGKRYRIECR